MAAGADVDARHEYHGDTPLIAAASLLVEDVGLRLVEAGADVSVRGLFGATALHWSAMHGLARLAGALISAGADIRRSDSEHDGSPLGWAVHGWKENKPGVPRTQPDVARLLVAAGAAGLGGTAGFSRPRGGCTVLEGDKVILDARCALTSPGRPACASR